MRQRIDAVVLMWGEKKVGRVDNYEERILLDDPYK
jgi:hypothetical protein